MNGLIGSLHAVGYVLVVLIGIGWSCSAKVCAETDDAFFESKIRPLLTERCLQCHSAEKGKTQGGLALDSKLGWEKGGDSGTAIVPGNVDESLLIQAVLYGDGLQMPPEEAGGKLSDAEIALLKQWIQHGAHDPRTSASKRGGMTEEQLRAWWSFQPLKPIAVPDVAETGFRNEIDHFISAKLESAGLQRAPEADRRTLIRRVTYDLTGLPPTAAEVEAFLADTSPQYYDILIERLLQSPRYGERWGRHWLDLVRYADTAGENTDHPIPDAWRYRNWVIEAFNSDLPYDQFVREQIAGDLLHANDTQEKYRQGIISTGYLAIARRFDHDIDKFTHLTIEDTIDTMGKTFLGLSVACARCHDHKYDPISTKDYYALYGILNSTRYSFPGCEAKQQPRDLVPLQSDAQWASINEPFQVQLLAIDAELKTLNETLANQASDFQSQSSNSMSQLAAGQIAEGANHTLAESAPSNADSLTKIDVKVGQIVQLTIDPSGDYGADSTLVEWEIQELGGASRKWNLVEDLLSDGVAANPHKDSYNNEATWLLLDGRKSLSLLPEKVVQLSGQPGLVAWRMGDNPAVFANTTDKPIAVWTSLPAKTLFVHPAQDGPVAIAWVSPFDGHVSIRGRIADAHPGGNNGVGWRMDFFAADHSTLLKQMIAANSQRPVLMAKRNDVVAQSPVREFAYAVTEGMVANAKQHLRGDPEKLGDEIPRRWLELFGGEAIPPSAGSGRLQLAKWMSDPSNPLVSRVLVNRIWQHHFGKGLVQTPNDFGTRGILPTHPELLDWLAAKFIENNFSIKSMHRVILKSATYRQSSIQPLTSIIETAENIDPNNNLLWRFDRRRLTAEEIRDSLLAASLQLDLKPAGAHPFPPSSTWGFSQHGPFAAVYETNKRSVYVMTLRNRRHPFFGLFDGADPNASTPERQVTTVPTQSLYFLNDPFFHTQSELIARRVMLQSETDRRLDVLFQIVFQRLPSDAERGTAANFLSSYMSTVVDQSEQDAAIFAWSALTRAVLSSNENLYLD